MSSASISPPGLVQRRAQLEGYWRARLARVTELSVAYHDVVQPGRNDRSETARRARDLARRAAAERQALAEIEAALDRIASGQYGRCEQCREPIAAALLARRPQARYCGACGRLADQQASSGTRTERAG